MRIVNGYVQSMDPSDLPATAAPGSHGHGKRAQGQPRRPQNLRAARNARARGGVQHDPEGMESGHTAHEESELIELHHLEGHHPRMTRKNAKRRGAANASHDPEQEGEEQDDALAVHESDERQDWRQRLVIQSGEQRGGDEGNAGGHGDEERLHDQIHEQRAGNAFRESAAREMAKRSAPGRPGGRDAEIGSVQPGGAQPGWAQSILLAQIAAIQQPGASAGRLERQARETMLRHLAQRVRKGRAADATDPAMAPGKLERVRAQLVAERQRLRERGIEPRPSVLLDEAQQRQFLLLPLKLLMLSSPGPRRHGKQAMATIQSLLGQHRRRS